MSAFPSPTLGSSLVLSFRLTSKTTLVIGSSSLAATRAFAALEAGAAVIVIAKGGLELACEELRWRANHQQLELFDMDMLPQGSSSSGDPDAGVIEAYISSRQDIKIALVCITDTLLTEDPSKRISRASATHIVHACQARGIPTNVTDMPELCDFSFTSTHRFLDPVSGAPTPLQIGVTTNGLGCRLASRLKREIVAKVPKEAGMAVVKVGKLRAIAKSAVAGAANEIVDIEIDEESGVSTPNRPVPQRKSTETTMEIAQRRIKWVAQVSEYWPFARLANMTEREMTDVLDGESLKGTFDSVLQAPQHRSDSPENISQHNLSLSRTSPPGRILLVGSGPGHPSLLTLATHAALTKHADLVLSDKLVPAAVLALIPTSVEVRIARKFPGNADGAQAELMEAAIEAARRGLTVVRLKQGDPTVYGRAGEEVLYFRAHGYEPVVVPGVSSVLAGPTLAGIPVTQRGAAESFVVCTGVGRQGKEVVLPGYERGRTLVVLMGVARLRQLLDTLQTDTIPLERRNGLAYPSHTPIAIIERASMPDQRAICSTLADIAQALESVGEQRPPGMIIIGWSILSLWGEGDVSVLEDGAEEHDEVRVREWLGEGKWRVQEGVDAGWDIFAA